MTRPDIDAIRKRCEAATPGPWRKTSHYYGDGCCNIWSGEGTDCPVVRECESGGVILRNDAEFISNARTDIPALLEYVAELEHRVDELQEELLHVLEEEE